MRCQVCKTRYKILKKSDKTKIFIRIDEETKKGGKGGINGICPRCKDILRETINDVT